MVYLVGNFGLFQVRHKYMMAMIICVLVGTLVDRVCVLGMEPSASSILSKMLYTTELHL